MSVKASQRAAMWVDWLIVLVFGGSALFAIWMPIPDGIPGPRLVNTFLFLLVSLLFFWRRRAPVAVLFLVVAVVSVQANFFDPPKQPPFHSWIALLLAFYCVGRYSDERRANFGGVVGLTAEILLVDLPRFLADTPPPTSSPRGARTLCFGSSGRHCVDTACRPRGSGIWLVNWRSSARRRRGPPSRRNAPGSPGSCTMCWHTA
jgi:hypothetical protein